MAKAAISSSEVEKHGPEIENPTKEMIDYGKEMTFLWDFVPVSSKVMDAMPNLRIIGLSRAGLENVNLNDPPREEFSFSTYKDAMRMRSAITR